MSAVKQLCMALSVLLLAGCDVRGEPTSLATLASDKPPEPMIIAHDVDVSPGTGFPRTLAEGSSWLPVGRVPAGTVYKSLNSVFTVEGTNVHEAYLVISSGKLMGFYLAAEGSYAALGKPIDLSIR